MHGYERPIHRIPTTDCKRNIMKELGSGFWNQQSLGCGCSVWGARFGSRDCVSSLAFLKYLTDSIFAVTAGSGKSVLWWDI
jgi:hypothetical protein